jgi:hypothetical protein
MEWVPTSAWLTKVTIDTTAVALAFDLAIDASGQGAPSRIQAGLQPPSVTNPATAAALAFLFGLLALGAIVSLRGFFGATSRPTAAGA